MISNTIILKPGKEKPLLRRHPWVFSGAIGEVKGKPASGDCCVVRSAGGEVLGSGMWSEESQLKVRMYAWAEEREMDEAWFREKLAEAREYRDLLRIANVSNAQRLVFSEADGMPGLVVDQLGDGLVIQITTWGMETRKAMLVDVLKDMLQPAFLFEDASAETREKEGLPTNSRFLFGAEAASDLVIEEHGIKYQVQLEGGQKTGFYIDQRENRKLIREYAAGKAVLDSFSYSGGFALNAAQAGAESITVVDSSADAISLVEQNIALNGLGESDFELYEADVFQQLRRFRDGRKSFDLIVLDPPKFAPIARYKEKAARAYKDINLLAFKLLKPGGILFTFSCSGGVDRDFFQKVVADAAVDAVVQTRIIADMAQAADHPVALNFPESRYLKGMVVRRD